jgi:hypothetical protein
MADMSSGSWPSSPASQDRRSGGTAKRGHGDGEEDHPVGDLSIGHAAVPDRRPTGIAHRAAGILEAIAVDHEDACTSHRSEPMLVRSESE